MKPMRLVFLSTSSGWGGLEMNMLRHARWMASAGHVVRVACVAQTSLDEAARALGDIEVHNIHRGARYFNFSSALSWAYALRKFKADWLWIRDPRDLDTASWCRRFTPSTKLVFHQGMQIPRRKRSPIHWLRYRAIDQWVTPLEWLAEQVVRNTPMRNDRVAIIPLGLDDRWFEAPTRSKTAKKEARLTMGLSQDVFVAVLVGRIDPKKGQDVLVRALSNLPEDVHAMLVGDPTQDDPTDYFDRLRALIKDNGLKNRVHVRPYLESPQTAFLAADVAVVCSLQESIGSVTLEAMASGRPVVGANSGGTAALLADGRGWTFEPGDAAGLALQLAELRRVSDDSDQRLDAARTMVQAHRRATVTSRWENVLSREGLA